MARTPRLLVASDYDGTMAPIVANPDKAYPRAETVRALRSLASLASTTAAVISGRALKDLAALSRLPAEVQLVGSHGSEFDIGFVHAIDADARKLLDEIVTELGRIAADTPGATVEKKPASVALHVRNTSADDAEKALIAAEKDIPQRDKNLEEIAKAYAELTPQVEPMKAKVKAAQEQYLAMLPKREEGKKN